MTKKPKEKEVQQVVVKRVPGSNKRVVIGQTYTHQEFQEYQEMLNKWRVYATR